MRYMLVWHERPMGSAADYEAAQDRTRALLDPWTLPPEITTHSVVARLDGYGGYALVETEDAHALHVVAMTFPMFQFEVVPVMDFDESMKAKRQALAWREQHSS